MRTRFLGTLVLPAAPGLPADPEPGQVHYDRTTGITYVYAGDHWEEDPGGGGGGPSANTKGFVFHGADPDVARPTGFTSVEWMGSVPPANAVTYDTWVVLT
jgi:hypothetical protein